MALYRYQAFSKDGKKITGSLDASTDEAVRERLAKMGAYPISIIRQQEETLSFWERINIFFAPAITLKDKILFTKQLAVLLKSGVPLLQALELLVEQFSGRMHSLLIDVKDGLKEGQSLAEGLKRYPKIFENVYVQLVRAGEASGNLEVILEQLVVYLERRAEITKRVKSAMRYPLIQLGIITLVFIGLLTFVIPSLAETLEEMGRSLPGMIGILMGISNFITSYYLLILALILLSIGVFWYWKSTATGARTLDAIKLRIPIFGFFSRMGAIVQFSRTLGMLIAGGVNLAQALDIVVSIVDNRILATTLQEARDKIIKQGRIAEFLKQTNIFPPIAIYLIKTGEESGKLDAMLLTVAQNYEADLLEYSDNLSAMLEPIMQIVIAGIVGIVVMSIMGALQPQEITF